MLQSIDLEDWLHRDLRRLDKILILLATFDSPVNIRSIKEKAQNNGLRIPTNWNVSALLGGSSAKAIRVPDGWKISSKGEEHLRQLGLDEKKGSAHQPALDLRSHLPNLHNTATRNFVEEAIKCHEIGSYRAAIIMAWIGALSVLQEHTLSKHIVEFNQECSRVYGKRWKQAKTTDDLSKLKESEFLDRLESISVIGKSVKDRLQQALKLRNGCGHPNTLKVSRNQSAAHLEILIQNVFEKF